MNASLHGRPALKSEALSPGMRVGLFGGSFDPVHDGHLHVARAAMRRLGLDRVWWLVSPQNPLKGWEPADYAARLEAVEAVACEPRMVATDIEARLGVGRTADLIDHLTARWPTVRFVWIMGADSLAGFDRWRRWRDIAAQVPLCVVSRPGAPLKARLGPAARELAPFRLRMEQAGALAKSPPPRWTYLTEPLHPASSTALRAQVAEPRPKSRPGPHDDRR